MSKPIVLFLCTGNSARSQMAEALLRKYGDDRFEVHSAGLNPTGINPLTIQVMNEVGIDMDGYRSKSVNEYLGKLAANYVIFVCEQAEKSCPRVWPFSLRSLCWPFDDPAACEGNEETKLQRFRDVRDQIENRIKGWLATEVEADDVGLHEKERMES